MFALLHIQHPAPPFRRRQDSLIFFCFYELCASFSKIAHVATIILYYYTMFLLPFQQVLAFPFPAVPLSLRSSKAALYDRSAQNKGAALRPLPFLRRAGAARPTIRLQMSKTEDFGAVKCAVWPGDTVRVYRSGPAGNPR